MTRAIKAGHLRSRSATRCGAQWCSADYLESDSSAFAGGLRHEHGEQRRQFQRAETGHDPDDAVLLLIDHQSGLFQTVKDMEMTVLRANATTLAKVATLAKIPVITSASVPRGPNGPLIPEIHKYAPHAKYVAGQREHLDARLVVTYVHDGSWPVKGRI
jgi:hypothetical protein